MRNVFILAIGLFGSSLLFATCVGELRKNETIKEIYFFSGEVGKPPPLPAGFKKLGSRAIVHVKQADGSRRLYKEIYEETFSSEEEAKKNFSTSAILQHLDETHKQAELIGGPHYYGMQLIKVDEKTWTYFAVMDDFSTAKEYYSLKGIKSATLKPKQRRAAQRLFLDKPSYLGVIVHDVVSDVARGVARVDPDFIVSAEGVHWIDIDMWRFSKTEAEARTEAAYNVVILYSAIDEKLQSREVLLQLAQHIHAELALLAPEKKQNLEQELVRHLRLHSAIGQLQGPSRQTSLQKSNLSMDEFLRVMTEG